MRSDTSESSQNEEFFDEEEISDGDEAQKEEDSKVLDSEEEEFENSNIQEEFRNVSALELLQLKEKLGLKKFNEAVFGAAPSVPFKSMKELKRPNKNRPQELPIKVKGPQKNIFPGKKQREIRDPRFDPRCSVFNKEKFERDYAFLDEIKHKEKEKLKRWLREETDPQEKQRLKKALQRMENQEREKKRRLEELEEKKQEKQRAIEALKAGKKPFFMKKSEKRKKKMEELMQNERKYQKYIKRKDKKLLRQDKRDLKL